MGQLLAIDYGKKRCGIAVTDDLQLIASGLTTVPTHTLLDFLERYTSEHEVETFIVGEPRQMNYEFSENETIIRPFLNTLSKCFPEIPVERVDERFTSKMAFQTLIDSGVKKKGRRDKELIDEVSAALILQSYLYQRDRQNTVL